MSSVFSAAALFSEESVTFSSIQCLVFLWVQPSGCVQTTGMASISTTCARQHLPPAHVVLHLLCTASSTPTSSCAASNRHAYPLAKWELMQLSRPLYSTYVETHLCQRKDSHNPSVTYEPLQYHYVLPFSVCYICASTVMRGRAVDLVYMCRCVDERCAYVCTFVCKCT